VVLGQGESLEMLFWRKKAERAQRMLEDLGAAVEGLEGRLKGVEAIFGDAASSPPKGAAERNIATALPQRGRAQARSTALAPHAPGDDWYLMAKCCPAVHALVPCSISTLAGRRLTPGHATNNGIMTGSECVYT
jgi:hypothetical protein